MAYLDFTGAAPRRGGRYRRQRSIWRVSIGETRLVVLAGAMIVLAVAAIDGVAPPTTDLPRWSEAAPSVDVAPSRTFSVCFTGGGTNCVVDGDTFWIDGETVRIADIDTPETHPPRCAEEARLGAAATDRLRVLLNAGPVTLVPIDRDVDRYGRKLRVVERDGVSIGEMLVAEGLARRWEGRRRPWCEAWIRPYSILPRQGEVARAARRRGRKRNRGNRRPPPPSACGRHLPLAGEDRVGATPAKRNRPRHHAARSG